MINQKGTKEERWENQKKLALRIARTTTRILPDGEGVALRFINQETNESPSLDLDGIGRVLNSVTAKGDTPIGTTLRERILKPLVYDPLAAGTMKRPLLVSILTDGAPSREEMGMLASVIVDCGNELVEKGYPKDCVFSLPFGFIRYLFVFGLLSMVCRREVLDRSDWVVERRRQISEHAQESARGQRGHCPRTAYLCW